MKENPILSHCPVCSSDLLVKKLHCSNCDTTIEGNFTLSKFNYLNKEHLYFIEVFIKNRGNIKLVERELNISYPTVKKMLDEVIVNLGYKVDDTFDEKEDSINVLDQVKEGKLTVEEALLLLKK